MEPRIQYAKTSHNVRIAYSVIGQGFPLVYLEPLLGDLRNLSEDPTIESYFARLAAQFHLILYDGRGHGLSDREVGDLSIVGRHRDIEAVVTSIGVDEIVLFGQSVLSPAAIFYAHANPTVVKKLVLYGAYAKSWQNAESAEAFLSFLRVEPEFGIKTMIDAYHPEAGPELKERFLRLSMRTASIDYLVQSIREIWTGIDIRELLAEIHVPTLVVHRRGDATVPLELGREVASLLPNATFVTLEGRAHDPALGDIDALLAVVREFLVEEIGGRPVPNRHSTTSDTATGIAGTAVILFADIADSTALTERLGDAAFRAKARTSTH
jgi:pimeloyl-ACP methyl ester carboxylesterase